MKQIKSKNIKWWIGIGSCMALFLIIGIFAYSKMCFMVKGVEIQAMVEKESADSKLATITGKAPNAIHLSLNDREIFIDKDGSFSEKVVILPGFSVVTLDAVDKFGHKSEKKFELIQKENAESIAFEKVEEEIIN